MLPRIKQESGKVIGMVPARNYRHSVHLPFSAGQVTSLWLDWASSENPNVGQLKIDREIKNFINTRLNLTDRY